MLRIDARNKCVLFISDTHIPYSHPNYLTFLKRLKDSLPEDTIVIHVGDETDYHDASMHDSIKELDSAGIELAKSIIELQEGLYKLFPKMYLLESNHGSLLYRRAKKYGIPIRAIKDLPEIYETPGWSWHFDIILETNKGPVYVCHGMKGGYNAQCKDMGMSAVQGHFHAKFEVTYHQTATHEIFNMFVGCLIDPEHMAFEYGKNINKKPIIGTGWIDQHGNPHLAKMPLDDKGRLI